MRMDGMLVMSVLRDITAPEKQMCIILVLSAVIALQALRTRLLVPQGTTVQ